MTDFRQFAPRFRDGRPKTLSSAGAGTELIGVGGGRRRPDRIERQRGRFAGQLHLAGPTRGAPSVGYWPSPTIALAIVDAIARLNAIDD